ncbi:MAG: DNA polymerase IV [Nitrososphaerota archaeon]|nr:DNA polymerase IV [Nitrososphaerota archaeon]MDG7024808.1 DNA polymerase IV [Nitrososphaerota archaeon]
MQSERKTILHVDLDAFYVSAERRERPELRGLPVVVGADPEGGKGRGVVITCSYEARKFGLRSGMPISQAYRLCPQATYIPPNWGLYERVSEEVMATLRGFADRFEQGSIDEAYLDVTSRARDEGSATRLAKEIKKAVLERRGLTCSIGVAPNKSSAKIASDHNKPDGLTVVPFDKVADFLAPLPVGVVPGIGRKTGDFLSEKGISTIGQLQELDGKQLVTWFGKNGVWLWGVIHGEENVEVRQQEMPKSLSVERTFTDDVKDFRRVREEAADGASELMRRVKSGGYSYRVAGVKIRFRGFETHTREKTLVSHTDDEGPLREAVDRLLDEFETKGKPVRLIGVRVADIQRSTSGPLRLDDWVGA